ncbi:MAG TPA: TauD/TfdA family dioxygenase [Ilumatobacteraceae bacterium]|jgi:alpha-ketoglutarate-dependent taurine dioxygenase
MHSNQRGDDARRVRLAEEQAGMLPDSLRNQVRAFQDAPPPAGCMLLRGLPVGELPPTPATPTDPTDKSESTELLLLSFASLLGAPVGYLPEHGGDVVQNIVPVRAAAASQTSTSSTVDLMFHTEAAFHPHRPRYLLLFCLRGDPQARTTVASIHASLPRLASDVIEVLFQPRFRCWVDESYLHGRSNVLGPPMAVLRGTPANPTMVFDHDLMVGMDLEADEALQALATALATHHMDVVLEPGDLLIIDNDVVVHGRSPFPARFDGTDRWLQRAFVVDDLIASEDERTGRTITTVFGE